MRCAVVAGAYIYLMSKSKNSEKRRARRIAKEQKQRLAKQESTQDTKQQIPTPNALPEKNHFRGYFFSFWKFLKNIFSLIGLILTVFLGYQALKPKILIHPLLPVTEERPNDPFSHPFELVNKGLFEMVDVTYRCVPKVHFKDGLKIYGIGFGRKLGHIVSMEPGESRTFPCTWLDINSFETINNKMRLDIYIYFKYKFFWKYFQREHSFTGVFYKEVWHWQPLRFNEIP